MSFVNAASEGFLDTFRCDSQVELRVPYLIAMQLPVVFLVESAGVCAILEGSKYDIATALLAWDVLRLIDCLEVTTESVAELIFFSMRPDTFSVFTIGNASRLVQDGKESFIAQPLLHAVLCLRTSPTRASVRRTADKNLHGTYQPPLPSSLQS